MEVLQVQPVPEIAQLPPLCSPASSTELSPSLAHQVRARLSRIPPVPTTIKVPENTKPKPLTHTSSLKTPTTSNASHSSNADTVATSILLVPSLFFTSKIHVAPTMHIEEDLLSIWDQRVRITLKEVLLREITTGSCIQELMMAGKDPVHLKPTVVVTCGSSRTQKLVRRVFRRQSWLKSLLKTKGMGFVAVIQPVHLSSSSVTTLVTTTTATSTSYGARTPTSAPSAAPSPGLSGGVNHAVAIAVGVTSPVGIIVAGVCIFFLLKRRRRMQNAAVLSWVDPRPEMSNSANLNHKTEPHGPSSEPNHVQEVLTEQGLTDRQARGPFILRSRQHSPASGPRPALDYFAYIDPDSNVPCGQKLYVTQERESLGRYCTFGGLILVSGSLYALTAGHPFPSDVPISDSIDTSSPSIPTPGNEVVKPDSDSSRQPEPFWFDPESDVALDNDSETDDQTGSDDDITDPRRREVNRLITQIPDVKNSTISRRTYLRVAYASNQPLSTTYPMAGTDTQHSDWALLSLLRSRRPDLSNTVTLNHDRSDQTEDTTIIELAENITQGDVHILCGTTPRPGHLCPSTSTIQVDGKAYDVRLVILNENLPPGCSGSWVITGQKLCGHIISAREDVPWAYMLPIQSIVQDIKRVCDTDDVRLPSAADMEDLAGDEQSDEEIAGADVDHSSSQWSDPQLLRYHTTRSMTMKPGVRQPADKWLDSPRVSRSSSTCVETRHAPEFPSTVHDEPEQVDNDENSIRSNQSHQDEDIQDS